MLLQRLRPLPLFTPKKKQHKYGKEQANSEHHAGAHFYHSSYWLIPDILGKLSAHKRPPVRISDQDIISMKAFLKLFTTARKLPATPSNRICDEA